MDFPYEKDSKERLPYEHYIKIYQSMKPEDMAVHNQAYGSHLSGVVAGI